MRKISVLATVMGLLFCVSGGTNVYADCPDYKIVCQDETSHGPYGTC